MFNAWSRRDRAPEDGTAAGLDGFAVDKTFLSSLKGILLETELALTFIIFICFTASISAYMAAALLEFFITLAFLFLYATQYYQRFDRMNWPSSLLFLGKQGIQPPCPILKHGFDPILQTAPRCRSSPSPAPWLVILVPVPVSICVPPLGSCDFLRCVSAIIIFLVVSFAAVTSRDGAAIAAFVFGIILVSVFAYDAFKIYRTEMVPRAAQGE
ncbi:CKLF-like MARVEL transmembrane domain-containing protein 5, partial [Bos mutus]